MPGDRHILAQLQRALLISQEKINTTVNTYINDEKQRVNTINKSSNPTELMQQANILLDNSIELFNYIAELSKQKEFSDTPGFLISLQLKANNQVKENFEAIYQKNPDIIIDWLKNKDFNKENMKTIESFAHILFNYLNYTMRDVFKSDDDYHSETNEPERTITIATPQKTSLTTQKLYELERKTTIQHEVYKILAQKGSPTYAVEYLNSLYANNIPLEKESISLLNFLINLIINDKNNKMDDERTRTVIQHILPAVAESFVTKKNINHKTKYFREFIHNCEKADIFSSDNFLFETSEKLYGSNHEALFLIAFNKMIKAIDGTLLDQKSQQSANAAIHLLINVYQANINFTNEFASLNQHFSKNKFTQLFFDALSKNNIDDLAALYTCCKNNGNAHLYEKLDHDFKAAATKINDKSLVYVQDDLKNYLYAGRNTLELTSHLIKTLTKKDVPETVNKAVSAPEIKDSSRSKLKERFEIFKRNVLTTGSAKLIRKRENISEEINHPHKHSKR